MKIAQKVSFFMMTNETFLVTFKDYVWSKQRFSNVTCCMNGSAHYS